MSKEESQLLKEQSATTEQILQQTSYLQQQMETSISHIQRVAEETTIETTLGTVEHQRQIVADVQSNMQEHLQSVQQLMLELSSYSQVLGEQMQHHVTQQSELKTHSVVLESRISSLQQTVRAGEQ
ncbi:hypothetical protein [Exiguobacterium sp. s161]|uniref:hypothetical protein n=1 Tax=Exiguobacterium sp. s161 TaxID=2751191 RepID=UPI001BEC52B5|nr:hypothetical protein [Exiguobacterium sp. s161]